MIRETTPPPPSEVAPWVDREIDAIVGKMLARLPAERFASCQEVAAALAPIVERAQAGEGALARFLEELNTDAAADPTPPMEPAAYEVRATETRRIDPVVLVPGAPHDDRPHTMTGPARCTSWRKRGSRICRRVRRCGAGSRRARWRRRPQRRWW